MITQDFSGITEIDNDGIKKHFKKLKPWQAIAELAWNGFDANASNVEITTFENNLGKVERVSIFDNGDGIDFLNIKSNFGKFNDSAKKEDVAQHGLHGRGRLAFHRLCSNATWYTKTTYGNARVEVSESNIKHYKGHEITPEEQSPLLLNVSSGTVVELNDLHTNIEDSEKLGRSVSSEFGWYLAINKERSLKLNGEVVELPRNRLHPKSITISNYSFDIFVFVWKEKLTSEKSHIYLVNDFNKVVYRQLSSFNKKPDFHTSIYIKSKWADNFTTNPDDLLSENEQHTTNSDAWRHILREATEFTHEIYEDFLRDFVESEIDGFVEKGIFPSYHGITSEESEWRMENTKIILRSLYIADPTLFNSLNLKQKKIVVRLLDKLSISNENDAIFDILNGVLELDDASVKKLATQLKRTQLENIVSAIEILQQRQSAVNKIRELMNIHYKEVLETPDLQQIIENNTWLFGSKYETIGAEEDSFTKIAKNLRDKIKHINEVDEDDVESDTPVAGAARQTDLFLARKYLTHNSFGKQIYKCTIIEIKRPGIALNKKHLRQLDDYADIILRYPEFSSELTSFELILVGRKISSDDTEIKSRMRSHIHKGEMGLVSDDDRIKRYVLNWYTLLDSFEISNSFMLDKLKLKRDQFSTWTKSELVEDLQQNKETA